ncbi:MAG: ABC transporter ATP-binding protein [Oscillospiraceae bacterium]
MNNFALEIKNLTKEYNDFTLNDVSFTVEKGSVMGLIGQNGAGKTTIIKLIMNCLKRKSGSISVFGLDNIENEPEVKNKIGYVADEDYLLISSTMKAHANAYKIMFENWDQELFEKYSEMWKLPLKKKFSEYSKGMKTKAMLSLALSHNPEILILDEPTAGLDPVARIEVLDILRDFVSNGEKAVLFSTHITGDLDKIADYITLLIDGNVTESLSVDKVEEKYAVISGDNSVINGKEGELVGLRKGTLTFEALIKRDKLRLFEGVSVHTPNIENLLTFSIWGNSPKQEG